MHCVLQYIEVFLVQQPHCSSLIVCQQCLCSYTQVSGETGYCVRPNNPNNRLALIIENLLAILAVDWTEATLKVLVYALLKVSCSPIHTVVAQQIIPTLTFVALVLNPGSSCGTEDARLWDMHICQIHIHNPADLLFVSSQKLLPSFP